MKKLSFIFVKIPNNLSANKSITKKIVTDKFFLIQESVILCMPFIYKYFKLNDWHQFHSENDADLYIIELEVN